MIISIIVAISNNNVIGREGRLPWHLSGDLKNFKKITLGKPIIMGRLTYESIGHPLPDRHNIIISSQNDYSVNGCDVVSSPKKALELAGNVDEVIIIGGSSVYAEYLPQASRLYITRVDIDVEGDVFFPEFSKDDWIVVKREKYKLSDKRQLSYIFELLERR